MAEPIDRRFIVYSSLAGLTALPAQFFWPDFWLICTSLLSATGGLYGLAYLLKRLDCRFNFFLVGATAMVWANAIGILLSFVIILSIDYAIWTTVVNYVHTTITDLVLAQAYTNLFASVLWLLGSRLQRSGVIVAIHEQLTSFLYAYKYIGFSLLFIVLMSQWYLLQQRIVVYGGNSLSAEGEPTHPLQALLGPLAPTIPFLLGYYMRKDIQAGRWLTALGLGLLLLAELYWFFLFGRRSVLHFFVFLLLSFGYGTTLTGRLLIKNTVPIIVGLFLILKVADTYHRLRTVYGFENLQQMSVVEGLVGLQDVDEGQYGNIRKLNLAARSSYSLLALGQFMTLFRTTTHRPLGGQVLVSSLLRATPSNFFLDKKSVVAKEALYEIAYSLTLTDISETLALESFIDFGWYGCLLYAGFLYGLFYGLYVLAYRSRHPLFALLVACTSVSLGMSMIETDMITFLASLRMVGLIGVVFFLVSKPHRKSNAVLKHQ